MNERDAKIASIAGYIEGRQVATERVDICIKGVVLGFPASLEAFKPTFPFGLNYFLETKVIDDPAAPPAEEALKITFTPRHSKGLTARLVRLILFEARGQKLGQKQLDEQLIASFNNAAEAARFARYPGVAEKIVSLYKCSRFSELMIKTDAGIYLAQSESFDKVRGDICQEIFYLLGDLGQVIFDAFA